MGSVFKYILYLRYYKKKNEKRKKNELQGDGGIFNK